MTNRYKSFGGAAGLALALAASLQAQAADYSEPGCSLSGSVAAGLLYTWQNFDGYEVDLDWTTPFGEGAGLVTCGGLNIQADIAFYAHSGSLEDYEDEDMSQTNSHIGGALFFRDAASWTAGLQASWISQDLYGANVGVFRAGVFGEIYLDDSFTFGAAAAYYNGDEVFYEVDDDGFEFAAYGRFYATPDLSLLLRGDILLAETTAGGDDGDLSAYALTGEAEYMAWDQGLALFAGARYAEFDHDFQDDDDFSVEDTQVFGGVRFYFGQGGTLMERQRTAPVDNTSLFKEKLPNIQFGLPAKL